jgi:diadenosine tetraphosphate (Ap4A) HIT family hydrolase
MQDSIFTRIIKGEIPGEIIYQDDTSAALLTIQPLSPGHLMVVPKAQVDHLWDLDDSTYHHLFTVVKQMAERLKTAYEYERVGMIVEGFGVPHAHIHVFGYEKPLEPTIIEYEAKKQTTNGYFAEPKDLKVAAEKLRG